MNVVWPHGDPRDVARAIVADPRFHAGTPGAAPVQSLLDRVLAWLGARLMELFHAIGHVLGARTPWNVAIGFIVLALIAATLVAFAIRFVRLPARSRRASHASVAIAGTVTSADLIRAALAAARDERWHEAASALARAALHALDERGRLRFAPSRTPGEARRLLRDAAFDAFEREATTALFAEHAATAERFARLRAAYAEAFGEAV